MPRLIVNCYIPQTSRQSVFKIIWTITTFINSKPFKYAKRTRGQGNMSGSKQSRLTMKPDSPWARDKELRSPVGTAKSAYYKKIGDQHFTRFQRVLNEPPVKTSRHLIQATSEMLSGYIILGKILTYFKFIFAKCHHWLTHIVNLASAHAHSSSLSTAILYR